MDVNKLVRCLVATIYIESGLGNTNRLIDRHSTLHSTLAIASGCMEMLQLVAEL